MQVYHKRCSTSSTQPLRTRVVSIQNAESEVLGTTARVEGIVDQSARNRCTTETPGAPLLPRDRVDEIAVAFSL